MRKFSLFLKSTLGIIIILTSCSSPTNEVVEHSQTCQSEFCHVEQGHSPYSIDIMKLAYNYVKYHSTRGSNVNFDNVEPTHRHVRFTPISKYQVDALNETYTVYNFPLDAIPRAEAGVAVDAVDNHGYLYAMVEANAIMPDSIAYNELGTYHDPYYTIGINMDTELADEIAKAAYAIAKYGDVSRSSALRPWCPSGTIRVWDDLSNTYIPIQGLQVHIVNSSSSVPLVVETDIDGYFEGNITYSDEISYIIQWKGDEWVIKFDDMTPAMTVSYSSRMPLDLIVPKSNVASYNVATVYRAATYYWNYANYCTPPTMSDKVRITCYDEEHASYLGAFYPYDRGIDEPNIEIWCKNRTSQSIISTTFHELAHAAHYATVGKNMFNQTEKLIKESWTRYVQSVMVDGLYNYLSFVTNIDYTYLLHNDIISVCDNYQCFTEYTPDSLNIQSWKYSSSDNMRYYSPLFIDIVDGLNQREWYSSMGYTDVIGYPNDKIRVMGGIQLVEDLVFNNKTLAGVKGDLLQYIANSALQISTADVNDLFAIYEQIIND